LPFRLDLGRSQAAQHQPLPSYHHVVSHSLSRITVRASWLPLIWAESPEPGG
jgi:hypothetical protein